MVEKENKNKNSQGLFSEQKNSNVLGTSEHAEIQEEYQDDSVIDSRKLSGFLNNQQQALKKRKLAIQIIISNIILLVFLVGCEIYIFVKHQNFFMWFAYTSLVLSILSILTELFGLQAVFYLQNRKFILYYILIGCLNVPLVVFTIYFCIQQYSDLNGEKDNWILPLFITIVSIMTITIIVKLIKMASVRKFYTQTQDFNMITYGLQNQSQYDRMSQALLIEEDNLRDSLHNISYTNEIKSREDISRASASTPHKTNTINSKNQQNQKYNTDF